MTTVLYLDDYRAPVWREPVRAGGQDVAYEREEWVIWATCRQGDPDELFVRGAQQRQAAVICRHCPVRTQCLATALDDREEFGVWGGLTERQRRALLRHNPQVANWADYFTAGGRLTDLRAS